MFKWTAATSALACLLLAAAALAKFKVSDMICEGRLEY